MEPITDIVPTLLSASPAVLALIVGLAAIALAGFAIYVVHRAAAHYQERR